MTSDNRITSLLGIEIPLIQAPMAGSAFGDMVAAVSEAGGLGSLACASLNAQQLRDELTTIRTLTSKPINVNFFCHVNAVFDEAKEMAWRKKLESYYIEFGIDPHGPIPSSSRNPFDEASCQMVEEFSPEVVSFHFGLPPADLLARVKATGAKILSSATTVAEAIWLEERGCDAIIAQGVEAGGHRGIFLSEDISSQVGTIALVPQIADAVKVPVIAAGGISDARGIRAAFALGASAAQLGTAYLFTPEARISAPYRQALKNTHDDQTVLTNLFTGRPARGIINRLIREVGPISAMAPQFPLAGGAVLPLKGVLEKQGSGDFSSLWSGQAARLCRDMPAGELTRQLAKESGLL